MVFDAGGPLNFNCRYTSILTVVHHSSLRHTLFSFEACRP